MSVSGTTADNQQAGGRSRRLRLNSTLILMVASLLSAGLGLFRNIVIAAKFGTGAEIDAYYAAFRVPDLLYLLILGGALGSALIPVFSGYIGKNDPATAWRLANAVINHAVTALVVAAGLAFLLAPQIVQWILAPNFSPEQQALTTSLVRTLLLQPLILGLGGITLSLLNGMEHFLLPALAPLIYNISQIAGALLLGDSLGVYGLVVGVLVGAALYWLVQLPMLFRFGFRWRPVFDSNAPGLRSVLKALGPRLIGQAAFQINFIVITALASSRPNAVSSLEYAFRLLMLPHSIFALSVATVAFPALSRLWGAGNLADFKQNFLRGFRQILFFALPASLGLGLLAKPLVRTLLESGSFGEKSTELVSYALIFFSLGLVGYGIVEICTRAFYAMQDTRTPVAVALGTIGLNVALSFILINPLGHGGLALSLAVTNTLEMLILLWLLNRRLGGLDEQGGLWLAVLKIALAADVMACFLLFATNWLAVPLNSLSKLPLLLLTGAIIGGAALVYAASAYVLKIEELQGAVKRFLRR